jgi:hypothetical protein
MLDSAANAGAKGQSQFFTPLAFGQALALALPDHRPTIVDFNCGRGDLLRACAHKSTFRLLGADIDPCDIDPESKEPSPPSRPSRDTPIRRITGDLTRLFPLLAEVDFRMDLAVLNPPWDLWWYRDRLTCLAESQVSAVRSAFAAHDGRTTAGTIDSTAATLMMALDRMSSYGEGLLIANNATLERLITKPGAPHGTLAAHIWAHLVIPGNLMTGILDHTFSDDGSFHTGVIYFARGHTSGCQPTAKLKLLPSAFCLLPLKDSRYTLRKGAEVRGHHNEAMDTTELWTAVSEEWARLSKPARNDFNLWLTKDGTIETALSLFDQKSSRFLKAEANRLHQLRGKRPMQLVMQRSQREDLLKACGLENLNLKFQISNLKSETVWRVDPKLQAAVMEAVKAYHACRAPLCQLPPLQRLGFLDEEDFIECRKDLHSPHLTTNHSSNQSPLFRAGQTYPMRSQSVTVSRLGSKPNLLGEMESIEYSGQELAFFIQDEFGSEHCFMEGRLRDPKITITLPTNGKGKGAGRGSASGIKSTIDFTLQQQAEHFIIPEVPDVAALNPEEYQRNVNTLRELERILNE